MGVDLAPTLLELAADGAFTPTSMDGVSWAALAFGEASSLDRVGVRAEIGFDRALVTRSGMKGYLCNTSAMISKYPALISYFVDYETLHAGVAYPNNLVELQVYNLTADPTEQVNEVSAAGSFLGATFILPLSNE